MTDDASASEDETLKEKQEDALHRKAGKEVRRVLYVSAEPDEQVEVVITEDGVITEYFVEMSHQAKIRGNIYKGVIRNIDVNLQAAFVDFGSGKNGFLQIDEVHPEYWHAPRQSGDGKYPPIQKVLKEGDELLVQAVKEPAGSKGAFLTTWLSLAGRYLVLTPGQEQIGVSRKVSNPEERQRLKGLLSGIEPGEGYGVIIRTASEGADSESIGQDLLFLKKLYEQILRRAINSEAPCLLYEEADLVSRTVRDYWETNIDAIHIDSEEIYYGLKNYIDLVFPGQGGILKFYKEQRLSMWEKFGLQKQLSEITGREVVLPSGGRLVFDQTEALMAIDINSGKTQGKSNFEAMVYRTNLEAAEAIARHLRLRDIGGQVVIDFIEMKDRTHCREVEKTIRNAMRRDRARHDVGHISQFGLLELVRQRTGTSAISITSEPCPHCGGTGVRRNMEWQAQGVLREIKHKISCKNPPSICIHEVPFELGLYVLNNKRDKLNELEAAFGVKIEIKPV
ncbi:MAG: Rne/Rng family ribonuclease [Mailhella sp.]|nr:Rne/Rng family ribonuclease [Mailhella sp.]